mmetsp:Transcript_21501/g.67617  ORF Transcript_21501/g.67617 Transcript_21501/m.67617 type:complete len:271 (+) Transcript_21501:1942-2754(+)
MEPAAKQQQQRFALHVVHVPLPLLARGGGQPGVDFVCALDGRALLGQVGAPDAGERLLGDDHHRICVQVVGHGLNLDAHHVVVPSQLPLLGLLEPQQLVQPGAVVVLGLPRVEVGRTPPLDRVDNVGGQRVLFERKLAVVLTEAGQQLCTRQLAVAALWYGGDDVDAGWAVGPRQRTRRRHGRGQRRQRRWEGLAGVRDGDDDLVLQDPRGEVEDERRAEGANASGLGGKADALGVRVVLEELQRLAGLGQRRLEHEARGGPRRLEWDFD